LSCTGRIRKRNRPPFALTNPQQSEGFGLTQAWVTHVTRPALGRRHCGMNRHRAVFWLAIIDCLLFWAAVIHLVTS
jgi:hypothetical protein